MEWLNKGTVSVISGCMFAGKTNELIRRLLILKHAKKEYVIFKPVLERSKLEQIIVSHDKRQMTAQLVKNTNEIVAMVQEIEKKTQLDVIAFDEVQFLDKDLFPWIEKWARKGKIIICAGLDKDYWNEYDGLMARLLVRAEKVDKLLTICQLCNKNLASHTQRVDKQGKPINSYLPKILVREENYQARCRFCYKEIKSI